MTTNPKLTKVLEYLIRNDEEKAKELLHQVFIEKARAIHEDLMSQDEEMDQDMEAEMGESMHGDHMDEEMDDEMDETMGGSGDLGKDLTNEISAMDDEIDFEETMTEAGDDADDTEEVEMDMVDTGDDADMETADGELGAVEDKMHDLEAALAALKAEFDKLESGDEGEEEVEVDDVESKMDEDMVEDDFEFDEDFDELAESLDLEVIERDVLKTNKSAKDVGSASSGMTTGNDAKSPLPKSQTARMGAKPVETGKGSTHNGYNLEAAPKSADQGLGDNRRKKSTDGAKKIGKDGDSSALINKSTSDSFGAINNTSPLSKGGQNLK